MPVVQAYAYSKYLGHLELTFDDAGNVVYADGDTIVLDASVEENPEIVARVAELGGPIEELKAQVVGNAADMIEGDRTVCRAVECPMGNLVADAMLDRVEGSGRDHRHPERRRAARLDRRGRDHHGRGADGAAVPEHARHLRGDGPDHHRRARERR